MVDDTDVVVEANSSWQKNWASKYFMVDGQGSLGLGKSVVLAKA
jgi:hypothetical protein